MQKNPGWIEKDHLNNYDDNHNYRSQALDEKQI